MLEFCATSHNQAMHLLQIFNTAVLFKVAPHLGANLCAGDLIRDLRDSFVELAIEGLGLVCI